MTFCKLCKQMRVSGKKIFLNKGPVWICGLCMKDIHTMPGKHSVEKESKLLNRLRVVAVEQEN